MPIYFWIGLILGLFSPLLSLLAVMLFNQVKLATGMLIVGELAGWPLVIIGAVVKLVLCLQQ